MSTWNSLKSCENQDERAWFLIGNFIMSLAVELPQSEGVKANEKLEIETAISCFNLSLPQAFRLENFLYDCDNFAQSNWIICIHLMILQSRILCAEENLKLRLFATELPRIIGKWTADYIALSHPFVACQMCCREDWTSVINSQHMLSREVAKLVLSYYAKTWKLGSILLSEFPKLLRYTLLYLTSIAELVELIESKRSLSIQEHDLARRFIHYMPSMRRGNYGQQQWQQQQQESRQLSLPPVPPQRLNGNGDRRSGVSDTSVTSKIPAAFHGTSTDLGFSADAQNFTAFPIQDMDSQCSEPANPNFDPHLSANKTPLAGEPSYSGVRENSLERIFGNFFDGYEQMHPYTGEGFSSYSL
jgi:hypothetical protein